MDFLKKHKNEIDILFQILKSNVKEKFDVEVDNLEVLKKESRKKPLVYFRKMMMVILNETFSKDYSQEEIVKVVGRDRTSLIYHCNTHLNEYSRYNDYKEEYDSIKNDFLEKIENN